MYEELCSRGTHCIYIEGEKWLMWKKVKKNNLTITSKPCAYLQNMKKTHAKFHNNRYKTVKEAALTRGTNCLYIKPEQWLSSQCGKSDKKWSNNYSKPHAHPHTMKKTYAKYHTNRYKTVRGVALTSGTHCLYIEGQKWLSSQCGKSDKNCSNNYIQTFSYHEENTCKVSKQSV